MSTRLSLPRRRLPRPKKRALSRTDFRLEDIKAAALGLAAFFVAVALQAPVFKGKCEGPRSPALRLPSVRPNTGFCWPVVIRGQSMRAAGIASRWRLPPRKNKETSMINMYVIYHVVHMIVIDLTELTTPCH